MTLFRLSTIVSISSYHLDTASQCNMPDVVCPFRDSVTRVGLTQQRAFSSTGRLLRAYSRNLDQTISVVAVPSFTSRDDRTDTTYTIPR
jgi:hypothetical protein